ncbi:NAD(P)-binding domain-containing protein [bacterium]|nr:NAD(P)-binding domain-containing protein [bacterium]
MLPYAVIGAGPMGLCTARRLKQVDIPFIGFETNSDVGGLWDIDSPTSTMYQSAHLISSRTMTEFTEFPMPPGTPAYPGHALMKHYFQAYATQFELYPSYRFRTSVIEAKPVQDHWQLLVEDQQGQHMVSVAGVLIANGTLHKPKRIRLPGDYTGTRLHSAAYKTADIFDGQRVLIIGCGNSGCDIAVDAVHHARSVDIVVRRGYYFLPKFVMGKPIDTIGGKIKLPNRLKQAVDGAIIRMLVGKPSDYGLPDPDYRLYESHPVVNSLVLHHLGHGDITPRPGIASIAEKTVVFEDQSQSEYDLILEATGYELDYHFIDQSLLNWQGAAPMLYLNVFHPERDDLFLMGMVEAAGLGWQGRDDQARLVALYLKQLTEQKASAFQFRKIKQQQVARRCDGGMTYLNLDRMAYYVHKGEYLSLIHQHIQALEDH